MAIRRDYLRIENGKLKIINGRRRDHFRFSILHFQFSILCFLLTLIATLFLAGCNGGTYTNTRPVVKIGLIAPFEGLYRESGYEALAAMRSAIADSPLPSQVRIDILPLALDDSADPFPGQRWSPEQVLSIFLDNFEAKVGDAGSVGQRCD